MGSFEGRAALVTGGARGIGEATVRALAAVGMNVIVADVLDDEGAAVAASLGASAVYQHLDVTDVDNWNAVLAHSERQFGPLTALVNNAGILEFGGIDDLEPAAFWRVLDVNLVGPFLGIHCAAASLRRAGGGVVVNVSSTAGLMGYQNLAGYVASKWGLRGLTKAAALDLSDANIRVCSVHPGPIATPMTAGLDASVAAGQPIARFGQPEEVAAMIRFMIVEGTYSTGSEFIIDGGAVTGTGPVVAPSTAEVPAAAR
ncbi:3-alpha-hydroxysteroid dehydrogenase [Williamsia sp. 1138]|uniref:SDR family NAD(P)-dependent oxidoreductase n=1 Tax=Williamsia sp. 1138 TaxID=1903117 RepID=UPI000A0FFADB|nr:SDR family NAD(P)-dependent oxidoreductase [Williamsia sp. 1138]OZG29584.1 3-alpha-hydroxysteroid dehydrogenase [Williamsia sp. 1138]